MAINEEEEFKGFVDPGERGALVRGAASADHEARLSALGLNEDKQFKGCDDLGERGAWLRGAMSAVHEAGLSGRSTRQAIFMAMTVDRQNVCSQIYYSALGDVEQVLVAATS